GHKVMVGVTDTDDALEEIKVRGGEHVAMIFPDRDGPRHDKMGPLFTPNPLCTLKASPTPPAPREWPVSPHSPEPDAGLADSDSHQLPLNPEVKAKLPEGMETPATVKAMAVDFGKAADAWDEAYEFLKKEFATD